MDSETKSGFILKLLQTLNQPSGADDRRIQKCCAIIPSIFVHSLEAEESPVSVRLDIEFASEFSTATTPRDWFFGPLATQQTRKHKNSDESADVNGPMSHIRTNRRRRLSHGPPSQI